ncbi:MAG: hypothetical protein DLM60_15670 [Pseudonocardiales bacterium]|nr:MAG: hypothetical protein DLM60_15670 [Pseudonocardiales bacterium]
MVEPIKGRCGIVMSEQAIAAHYSQGELGRKILNALTTLGADPEHLDPDQIAPLDEFHIGGRRATVELLDQLDLRPGLRVLDVGSGLGGTARYLARRHGVEVTGVDLTVEYVQVATSLTRRAGLAELVRFRQGSATTLPFPDESFDRACMLHVGMNIVDKAALFAEIPRRLTASRRTRRCRIPLCLSREADWTLRTGFSAAANRSPSR